MNAYWFDYEETIRVAVYEDYFVGAGHWEWYRPVELIFAETRGKARAMFCKAHNLEFTEPVKTRLIKRNVDRQTGLTAYGDPLWVEIDPHYFDEDIT